MDVERASRTVNRVLGTLLGVTAVAALGFLLYLIVLSPDARAARAFFKQMPVSRIQSIVLEPIPNDPKPLSPHRMVITRRDQIDRIASLVRTAPSWRPNHPHEHWSMVLRFESDGSAYSGKVLSTSNQGVLFYWGMGTSGGPVYGTYRQDALGSLLEAVATEQTH